jgi:hypothetical protein
MTNSTGVVLAWRKSTRCESQHCVEVAHVPGGAMLVRDSKNVSGAVLAFTPGAWSAFVDGFAPKG